MSIQVQVRRGTTAEHETFTGAVAEITVDTTKDTLVVHDGIQVGGYPLATEQTAADIASNVADAAITLYDTFVPNENITTGQLINPPPIGTNQVFGQETLQHYFAKYKLMSNQNGGAQVVTKIVASGDSTTAGVGSTYGGMPGILEDLSKTRGYVNTQVVNRGQSGKSTVDWPETGETASWESTHAAGDLAENPDLLILRWGANDPFYNVTPLGSPTGTPVYTEEEVLVKVLEGYDRVLTTIRTSRPVSGLSILILTAGPMNDTHFGRSESYFAKLSKEMRELARKHQCAYIDIYGMFSNSWGGTGLWMDADATSGVGRSVHPHDELYEHISGAVADVIFPNYGTNWKNNAVRNTSATSVNRLATDLPGKYFAGIHLDRLEDLTGSNLGAPYDGIAYTLKQTDGAILQLATSVTQTYGRGIVARMGFNNTWRDHWLGATYRVSFNNSWADHLNGFAVATYKMQLDGTVRLDGVVRGGDITDGTVILTLPESFWPTLTQLCMVLTEVGYAKLVIDVDGKCKLYGMALTGGGASYGYVSLNMAAFAVY